MQKEIIENHFKMKSKLLLIISFCLFLDYASRAQANFNWAGSMSGTGNDYSSSIALDAAGDVYTTGWFSGTVDFDPGTSVYNLTVAGGIFDVFVCKYSSSGAFVWAKRMGGASVDYGRSIAVDSIGNVFITGDFGGTADFDPGSGLYNLVSSGNSDIFICKLDASGNFLWAKSMGALQGDQGYSIALDAVGNIYTTGCYSDTVDFNPGTGVFDLMSPGVSSAFVSKLDATGNFVWAKSITGTSYSIGQGLTQSNGNIYITGYFDGTEDFDPGIGVYNLSTAGSADIFVAHLDTLGNFVWAKRLGGGADDRGYSIAVDLAGNIYTTGYYNGTGDFDPGAAIYNLSALGYSDVFVSKLNPSGNFVWAKSMGGVNPEYSYSVAVDDLGSVYTTGDFGATADFDPGVGVQDLTSSGPDDVYISKLDSSGIFVWAKRIGSSGGDGGRAIAVDDIDNVFVTGIFFYTVDFDPGGGTYYLTADGTNWDIFVLRLGTETGINESPYFNFTIFPNPGNGIFFIKSEIQVTKIEVRNVLGETIYSSKVNSQDESIDLSNQSNGVYFVRLFSEKGIITKQICIAK